MAWQLTEDLETFLTTAGSFLRARAAANTIMLTATELLRAKGAEAYGDATPLFGWLAGPGGAVAAAFMHTPPFPGVLTDMTDAAAAELAADLAGRGRPRPPGGPPPRPRPRLPPPPRRDPRPPPPPPP